MIGSLFHSAVYQPIYNLLVFLYDAVPGSDFGVAIILLTVLLKAALIPLSKHQIESQKKIQEIQPEIKKIQQKYKHSREEQSRAIMAFYKERKVNPFSGCLPLILQLTVLIAIYRVLFAIASADFSVNSEVLYPFLLNPESVNRLSFGLLDLSHPSIVLAVITAMAQYYQMKMMMARQDQNKIQTPKRVSGKEKQETLSAKKENEPDLSQIMSKQMLYIGPAMTLFFGATFPSGLALYWLTSTLFMIGQQWYLLERRGRVSQSR